MKLVFSDEAISDLEAIVSYIARRDEDAAEKLGERVLRVIDALVAGEYEGPEHTMEHGDIVRSWPVPPVRVYYRRRNDAFFVVRVYHQARVPITR